MERDELTDACVSAMDAANDAWLRGGVGNPETQALAAAEAMKSKLRECGFEIIPSR